jgi:hypothetical protein
VLPSVLHDKIYFGITFINTTKMYKYTLLLLLFVSHSIFATDAEFKTDTKMLSIPTVIVGDQLLYDAKLHLNDQGLFSIVSYDETSVGNNATNKPLLINGTGTVTHILADDTEGSQHQKFILSLANGQTLLISHNIDLAPRIGSLKKRDIVSFYGEYVWNEKGGLVHWTHHDPAGNHEGGWLRHNDVIYQ